ncbi:MAG: PQQ-dependent sugar dehydrogenase, partial [Planctomycetes bacterium]|nr:PQQ-dependent sugar dehydrogenase [Planctomycetota bacterium]
YLYFFAEMQDADLYADIKEHDGQTWYNDVFELFFKPADDKPGYYEFQVNAAGTIMDMFLPRRNSGGFRRYIKDGEFHIDAKVKTNGTLNKWHDKDKGWTVEGRIPWRDFLRTGGRPTIGEVWKFALCRYDYSVDFEGPELSTCAPLKTKTYADFHHFEDYASLKFVGRTLQQSRKKFGVGEFQPTDTSRLAGAPDPPLPYRAKRTLAKLAVNFPIFAIKQPESSRLWFIDQPRSYAPSRICRTTEEPESGEFETLLTNKGVAYSIAFHPQFEQNGFVFVGLNEARNGGPKMTRICRFTMREDHFLEDSEKVMIEWPSDGHNGGAIAFGLDGMMYITSGDGTSDSDTNLAGQRLDHLLAKVLRIDVDHPGEKQPYSVPPDNPFVKMKGARPETWAYGFRNPWRMSVDPKTGHLWVGNNGQDLWEQVFFVTRGANFGWSVYEGGHPFYLDRKLGPTPVSKPAADHPHSEARSLTGGIVYYGKKFPELNGAYIYGDYSTGKIWAMKHNGKRVVWQKEIADTSLQISSFASNAKGDLLITDHRGD